MNATLKAIIEKHQTDLDTDKFDNFVRDAIKENVLDELLDSFYVAGITIPPEIVTEQLFDFYIAQNIQDKNECLRYLGKIKYLINKQQALMVKNIEISKK